MGETEPVEAPGRVVDLLDDAPGVLLVKGVEEASEAGFRIGMVTNAYWATTEEDALEWLRPLAGRVEDLSLSTDLYHDEASPSPQAIPHSPQFSGSSPRFTHVPEHSSR